MAALPAVSGRAGGPLRAVAMDGLAGVGKSTAARGLATVAGWCYLDTGATYRAVTLLALESGVVDVGVPSVPELAVRDVVSVAADALATMEVSTDPGAPGIHLAGCDRSLDIRSPAVTSTVSAVSAVPGVRSLLGRWQRAVVTASDGCICEGRDIGTVVLPDAVLKVWLTADPDARVARRLGDVDAAGHDSDTVRAAVERRDALDSGRPVDPARAAADAVVVDTTQLSADAVVDRILALLQDRLATVGSSR